MKGLMRGRRGIEALVFAAVWGTSAACVGAMGGGAAAVRAGPLPGAISAGTVGAGAAPAAGATAAGEAAGAGVAPAAGAAAGAGVAPAAGAAAGAGVAPAVFAAAGAGVAPAVGAAAGAGVAPAAGASSGSGDTVATNAGDTQASRQPAAKPCSTPEHRQFDFWVGDWEVLDPGGSFQGTNKISLELNDCVLEEHWVGAQGGHGRSFNIYHKNTGRWHQTWVSDQGALLEFNGHFKDGQMMLEGDSVNPKGEKLLHQLNFEPMNPDLVRQHWQISKDGGRTWETVFDGRYHRKR